MLVVMLVAIFIGIPISFTLLFLALHLRLLGLGSRSSTSPTCRPRLMKQDEFVAVPMFILMGYICDQAG
jgi:TRAP-type mannitol/chloroaromatic compound transport system permease large subunit